MNEFIKKICVREWSIAVKSIKKKEIDIKEKFNEFEIIRGKPQKELSERADEAVIYMQKMYREMREFRTETKSDFTSLTNKTSEGIDETRLLRKETNYDFNKMDGKYDKVSSKMDDMANTLKQTNKTLKEEFEKLSNALLKLATKTIQK
ncbi:MAG: hypothetical protein ABIE23_01035 [archaeon]